MAILITIEKHRVRSEFDRQNRIWYYSIVDVLAQATKSTDPRNYWKVLKNRLGKAQNKLVTQCNQLKMRANDGKFYLTDVADGETILGILKEVSPEYVLPFRQFFDENELNGKDYTTPKIASISPISEPEDASYPHLTEDAQLLIDGYTENNIITIQAFVAGIENENIFISVTHNSVTIRGDRKLTPKNTAVSMQEQSWHREELYWGKFSRTISLPYDVEIDEVEVTNDHGLMTIKLPLINKNRTRIVRVRSI